jgi:hypothetical protein
MADLSLIRCPIFDKPEISRLLFHPRRESTGPRENNPEGQELYEASGAAMKKFLVIAAADHNTIFFRGMEQYLDAIGSLMNIAHTVMNHARGSE